MAAIHFMMLLKLMTALSPELKTGFQWHHSIIRQILQVYRQLDAVCREYLMSPYSTQHSTPPYREEHTPMPSTRIIARKHHIRRYGFHGTSHQYVAQQAAIFLGQPLSELKIITLHLGNGASACAIEYGHSTETSMGMTPLEGLVMGSRSGDIDAGIAIELLRHEVENVDALDDLLNRKSGLKGLSGVSNDLREIETKAAEGDDRSRLAIAVFTHRVKKYIGAYAATMGGCRCNSNHRGDW